jgi:transforming growth factor-beta-induced protein
MRIRKQIVALSALTVALTACGDDDKDIFNNQPRSILEIAQDTPELSTLVQALEDAGLISVLSGPGPFTVFAPTDDAFAAIAVPTDSDLLANILLTHVVSGQLNSAQVLASTSLNSLAKTGLKVDAAALTVGGADLSGSLDIVASNGVIHILDDVIIPANIPAAVATTPDLSTLAVAVSAASQEVKDALSGPGPLTVFAPVNSAFAKLPPEDAEAILADPDLLDTVIGYHVVAGQLLSTDFVNGQAITMSNGQVLTVAVSNGGVTLTDTEGNEVLVTVADVRLLNGVVHFIDTVLTAVLPAPDNILEVAIANGSFTTLLSAATSVGLAPVFSGPGPLTLFAPTDDAFEALGVNLPGLNDDVLANILVTHVLPVTKNSFEVVTTSPLQTVANTSLSVDASGSPIVITPVGGTVDAALSSTLNVPASNGLIHVMDAVIVPPTILEVAQATPALSALVQAISQASAGVQAAVSPSTLTGADPITVFAPTNAAFAASGIDLGTVAQADLDAVLAGHVVGAQALSTELTDGQSITTLNGIVTVNINSEGAISLTDGMGNTVNVVATLKDIRTLTGVVHVIDGVLMPSNDT